MKGEVLDENCLELLSWVWQTWGMGPKCLTELEHFILNLGLKLAKQEMALEKLSNLLNLDI